MRTPVVVVLVAFLVSGCSGGGGGSDPTPTPTPTATPTPTPTPFVEAPFDAIAVYDDTFLDPSAQASGISGGTVAIDFPAVVNTNGQTIFSGGGCRIARFAPAYPAPPPTDGAQVTLTGTAFLKPMGPCAFTTSRYDCTHMSVPNRETIQAVDLSNAGNPPGLMGYVFSEQVFNTSMIGTWVVVNGFPNVPEFNSGTGALPVTQQIDQLTVSAFNIAAEGLVGDDTVDGSFSFLAGRGPVAALPADTDFLGTGDVEVLKPANSAFGPIAVTVSARGDGFDLDDASALLYDFPGVAMDVTFSCAGTGGTCGDDGTAAIKAMTLTGHVTKESVAGLLPFMMPQETATSEWLEISCEAPGDTVTLPSAAVQTVLDWSSASARRVELRAGRVSIAEVTDGSRDTRVIVGHRLVGHTDL